MSEQQQEALRILADQVIARLELRSKRRELEEALRAKDAAHRERRRIEQRFASFMDSGPFVSYMKDVDGRMLYYNRPLAARFKELVHMQRELTQVNLLLESLATTDTLTGLPLRRVFDERLRGVFREVRRNNRPLCVPMIDVDNFKKHNDTFGHQHGDAVLQALARCLANQLRPSDFITRYGGEEFAIATPETSLAGAQALAERLLGEVRRLNVGGQTITASIGFAQMHRDGTVYELVELADQALLAAKREGKNRAICWSEVYAPSSVDAV